MKRMVIVLGVTAVMAAVVALTAGTALAQEESLPDLTIDKTGPSTATPTPDDPWVMYYIDVANVGSGDAFWPSDTVLVRDDVRSHAGMFQGVTVGNFETIEGLTGLCCINVQPQPTTPVRTRMIWEWTNPPWESTDAIISPGGALRRASLGVGIRAPSGYVLNCATVDPDNVIVESDESNNTDCVTTKIVR